MSNEANSNEFSNKMPLPRIEKPAIRIDTAIKLYELDEYIGSIAAILSSEEYGHPNIPLEQIKYHRADFSPTALKILRMQYLEVDGISPVLDLPRFDTDNDFISLIYQINKDLTMRELDEFLSSLTSKLHTVIALDLKKDLSQSIKRITILGSRQRIAQEVLEIIDHIINFSKEVFLDSPLPSMIEAFSERYGWNKDYILTELIAEKLEGLIRRFRV